MANLAELLSKIRTSEANHISDKTIFESYGDAITQLNEAIAEQGQQRRILMTKFDGSSFTRITLHFATDQKAITETSLGGTDFHQHWYKHVMGLPNICSLSHEDTELLQSDTLQKTIAQELIDHLNQGSTQQDKATLVRMFDYFKALVGIE